MRSQIFKVKTKISWNTKTKNLKNFFKKYMKNDFNWKGGEYKIWYWSTLKRKTLLIRVQTDIHKI